MVRGAIMGLWIRCRVRLEVEGVFTRECGGSVLVQYSTLLAGR